MGIEEHFLPLSQLLHFLYSAAHQLTQSVIKKSTKTI